MMNRYFRLRVILQSWIGGPYSPLGAETYSGSRQTPHTLSGRPRCCADPAAGDWPDHAGAAVVGSAWLSDFLDGRAARASARPTSLGGFDRWADTLVGAGAVVGFVASGWLPRAVGVVVVAGLLGAFMLTRNEAMSMLLQATGYGWCCGERGEMVSLACCRGCLRSLRSSPS
jgi:phosphatidylglycerophosphate synthase